MNKESYPPIEIPDIFCENVSVGGTFLDPHEKHITLDVLNIIRDKVSPVPRKWYKSFDNIYFFNKDNFREIFTTFNPGFSSSLLSISKLSCDRSTVYWRVRRFNTFVDIRNYEGGPIKIVDCYNFPIATNDLLIFKHLLFGETSLYVSDQKAIDHIRNIEKRLHLCKFGDLDDNTQSRILCELFAPGLFIKYNLFV